MSSTAEVAKNQESRLSRATTDDAIDPPSRSNHEGNRAGRLESRMIWRRIQSPKPDDPFGPEDGCPDSVIRTAKWGNRFLNLSDIVGNCIAKSTLMNEMYQRRRRMHRNAYMHHFQEYINGRAQYVPQYRRMRDARP